MMRTQLDVPVYTKKMTQVQSYVTVWTTKLIWAESLKSRPYCPNKVKYSVPLNKQNIFPNIA